MYSTYKEDVNVRHTYILTVYKEIAKKVQQCKHPFFPSSLVNITPGTQFSHYSVEISQKGDTVMTDKFSG